MTTRRVPVGVFFALFTASGFAGLIYQWVSRFTHRIRDLLLAYAMTAPHLRTMSLEQLRTPSLELVLAHGVRAPTPR
jgi:hypothetical protein